MSLLNKASLIQIPSGYKDGTLYSAKPTNGDGDFTFSRGSNLAATRVNSDGLIDKGRENLYIYSQQIDNAIWQKALGSVTANAIAAPDGTTTADLFTENTATGTHDIRQGLTSTSGKVYTFSIHAKSNGRPKLDVYIAGPNKTGFFDLSSGSVIGGSAIDKKIESLGNGWYRCSVVVQAVSTSTNAIWILNNGTTQNYTGDGTSGMYFWGVQAELGLVATDYIETGASTAQAGILEDMPRLDYSGGATCPSLLLEPQRTNLFPHSEYFSDFSLLGGALTANDSISPEGVQNAYKFTEDSASNQHRLRKDFAVSAGTYTISIFVKGTSRYLSIYPQTASTAYALFDLENETITKSGGADYVSSSIENYGNDWYRLILTCTASASTLKVHFYFSNNENLEAPSYVGDGISHLHFYGAMVEAGSYPTSYIPTYGSSVTRSEDVCLNGGDSSTFNDSEGVFFFQGSTLVEAGETRVISISDGSTSNNIYMNFNNNANSFNCEVISSGSTQFNPSVTMTKVNNNKIAIKYKENDFALWINGVEVATDTSGSTPTGLDRFNFDFGQGSFDYKGNVKQAIYFNSALTDDELAALTTI